MVLRCAKYGANAQEQVCTSNHFQKQSFQGHQKFRTACRELCTEQNGLHTLPPCAYADLDDQTVDEAMPRWWKDAANEWDRVLTRMWLNCTIPSAWNENIIIFPCLNYSWFELFGPLDLRRASLHHDWKNWGSHDWELKRFLQVNPRDPTFEVWRQWRTPSATCRNPSTVSVSICLFVKLCHIGCVFFRST